MSCKGNFEKIFLSISASSIHSELCWAVYGRDLKQLNMLDEEQLQKVIELMSLKAGSKFLDVGCGLGDLTRFIASQTGAMGDGVDLAEIPRGASGPIQFITADIESLELSQIYDAVLFVDSWGFVSEPEILVRKLLDSVREGGSLVVCYSAYDRADRDDSAYSPKGTEVTKAFDAAGLEYECFDYTAEDAALWSRMGESLSLLKNKFIAEENEELFKIRFDEYRSIMPRIREGRHCRYVYRVSR